MGKTGEVYFGDRPQPPREPLPSLDAVGAIRSLSGSKFPPSSENPKSSGFFFQKAVPDLCTCVVVGLGVQSGTPVKNPIALNSWCVLSFYSLAPSLQCSS